VTPVRLLLLGRGVSAAEHILLVEDEARARDAMAVLLADAGYRVTAVADGVAALGAARRDPPALVISDVMMPRGDGFDLVRWLRARATTAHVPILLMSAISEPERRARGLDLGADDFVAKPVNLGELLARVRVHLRHAHDREALQRRSLIDPLTGVLNRGGIGDELHRELHRARRNGTALSVLMIDIDRFKALNDLHGHLVGDAVLRHVARAIAEAVRVVDHVGRYGGDEFVVVLPGAGADAARVLADRLRRLRFPHDPIAADDPIEVSVSIGAATLRGDDSTRSLLERADQAMYRSKRSGELPAKPA
jgi:two-component system cell cycle response regulator